jgi:hypothetical protein
MSSTLATTGGNNVNPFARTELSQHVNAGTIEVESSRAIAEAQGKLVIAKRFPRNEALAYDEAMQACRRMGLAEDAFFSFPRGRETISGATVHLAREIARVWGNIEYNIRELSRKDGVSEMQAFAWDLQTNTLVTQNFTVRHWRDTKSGGYLLTDERDIYELTANQGSRRLRSCIFAVLPSDLVSAAEAECKKTLAGNNDEPLKERVRKLIGAFGKYGVTAAMIEVRLGHSLDAVLPEELAELRSIWNSIKDGATKAGEWFGGAKAEPTDATELLADTGTPAAATAPVPAPRAAKPKPKPEPAPQAQPAPQPAPEPVKEAPNNEPATDTDDGDVFG